MENQQAKLKEINEDTPDGYISTRDGRLILVCRWDDNLAYIDENQPTDNNIQALIERYNWVKTICSLATGYALFENSVDFIRYNMLTVVYRNRDKNGWIVTVNNRNTHELSFIARSKELRRTEGSPPDKTELTEWLHRATILNADEALEISAKLRRYYADITHSIHCVHVRAR